MLDRTIPFYDMILKCDQYEDADIRLPQGYCFRPYQRGYEREWAALEYEIGDFGSADEAERYFSDTFLTDEKALTERGIFLANERGDIVGSCIAWHGDRGGKTVAVLHWLIVSPDYQGRGLGRALCRQTLRLFAERGEYPVYLHTQPWGYKAVLLYLSCGFKLQKTDTFSHYENQYDLALNALKGILDDRQYALLLSHSQ